MRALDVGCGGGFLAEEFARLGFDVVGVDPSTVFIEAARRHAAASSLKIDYRVGEGEQLPLQDRMFDVAYCCDVLEHVSDLDRVMSETARVLKPGGLYLFDTLNRTLQSKLVAIKVIQEWPLTRIVDTPLHQKRGAETPAFRPGRKRRVTSPEMSVVFASVFACPGTGCSPRPPRKPCCVTTAATPGSSGTLPSSNTPTGTRAARARRASWNCACSSPPARAENPWLAAGSQTVQQQALRDFAQAMAAFFDPAPPALRPSWRKAVRHEGFRIVGRRGHHWDVRRVSRKAGEVWVPKAGWVRFRWSRAVPPGAKSYRVTMDRACRWHVAFAVIPGPVPAPGTGEAVGIDRGVAVSAALSTGELLHCPALTARESPAAAPAAQARPRETADRTAAAGSSARSPG